MGTYSTQIFVTGFFIPIYHEHLSKAINIAVMSHCLPNHKAGSERQPDLPKVTPLGIIGALCGPPFRALSTKQVPS